MKYFRSFHSPSIKRRALPVGRCDGACRSNFVPRSRALAGTGDRATRLLAQANSKVSDKAAAKAGSQTGNGAAQQARAPKSPDELRMWLENMVRHHRFTIEEVRSATGLSASEIEEALRQFGIQAEPPPGSKEGARASHPLRILPYPGGRHPRIGFLDGAVAPQRDTKFSVFAPWDPAAYIVVDLPEAIWSNLGLTYLAHTHVPTIWTNRGVALEPREWLVHANGTLEHDRTLPNGIAFGARVTPKPDHIRMELWLRNGTTETLRDLRVQNCVMLKGAPGFNQQTAENKRIRSPYVACHDPEKRRWIITAWQPCHRPWTNPPVPCLHSDPKFPDCAPNETQRVRGWLSFYEGSDINAELNRIDALGWATE